MFNQDTIKALSSMLKAASTDESRYHLCSVLITKHSKVMLKLEATDGHVYAKRFIECPIIAELLKSNECVSLEHSHIKALKATKSNLFDAKRDGQSLIITDCVTQIKVAITSREENRFPNMKQLENTNKATQPFTISFNAKLLSSLAEALADNPKRPAITLTMDLSAGDAKAYSIKCGENEGLLMPLRAEESVNKANSETLAQLTAAQTKGA
jgi:hypothetical protein